MGGFIHGVTNAIGITHDSSASNGIQGAYNQFSDLNAPNLQQLALQQLGPSAYASLNPDAQSTAAQNTAMSSLSDMATNSGLTPAEQARLQQVQQAAKVTEQGQRGAIDQSSQARGLINSGSALAAKLMGTQGNANGANAMGTELAGQAGTRQANAATALGNLGTSVGGQRFNEGAMKASAADTINAYNNQIANEQQMYNTQQLPQQNFANQMQLRGVRANLLENKGAAQAAESAQNTQNLVRGATAGMNLLFSDKRLKSKIKDAGPKLSKILDSVKPKSFDYRAPSAPSEDGPQVGVLAQDLEKTPEGKGMVEETPMGKAVNGPKMAAVALAASASLHKRLKKLEGK